MHLKGCHFSKFNERLNLTYNHYMSTTTQNTDFKKEENYFPKKIQMEREKRKLNT